MQRCSRLQAQQAVHGMTKPLPLAGLLPAR